MLSSFVQFIIPILIISVIYYKITNFLKENRYRNIQQLEKQKKTNQILISFSLLFLISWLPFSIFCLIVEAFDLIEDGGEPSIDFSDLFNLLLEILMNYFTVFHLLGMTSAVINPILYGFLNRNISSEIIKTISKFFTYPRVVQPPLSYSRMERSREGNGSSEQSPTPIVNNTNGCSLIPKL